LHKLQLLAPSTRSTDDDAAGWLIVEGFDIAQLEKRITSVEQRFLATTTGVTDPSAGADEMDLLSQLKHRTNNLIDRIVTRPNLRSGRLYSPPVSAVPSLSIVISSLMVLPDEKRIAYNLRNM